MLSEFALSGNFCRKLAIESTAGFKFGIESTASAYYIKCKEFALSESGIAPPLTERKGLSDIFLFQIK